MNRKLKRGLLITAIFAFAILGSFGLSKMKPPPQTKDLSDVAPLVEVMTLEAMDADFRIASQGTVRPRTETILSAEISGAIVGISPKYIPGGVFQSGEELMRIDPTNYAVAVDRTSAMLTQRQIEFDGAEKLRSQGYRAESEYASAAAALAAAEADLANARRNLERTRISLPYDGMVRAKDADLGQFVGPGTRLGITFATDYAEIRLPLTDQDLAFIELPDATDISRSGGIDGPLVELSALQKGQKRFWQARIVRTEGIVDEKSRVTYAVARIEDPYKLKAGSNDETPIPMGTFVAAEIAGMTVSNVVRVPRIALRPNNQLMFVDADDRLQIRTVDVLRSDSHFSYLRGGVVAGDRICLTTIESPLSGIKVRTENVSAPDPNHAEEEQHLVETDRS
ncbi:MAG: efflux RND transporter periplasmic adaptor subunit [Proteobacteria bacterium]|nr:efflux RND transporter periplasmic adaptor subunit [Pseudomonadota bacterium]MDA0993102.1 efflux RND transporter periplasmic adaptor subunit [Pseudomonadota bacterium]